MLAKAVRVAPEAEWAALGRRAPPAATHSSARFVPEAEAQASQGTLMGKAEAVERVRSDRQTAEMAGQDIRHTAVPKMGASVRLSTRRRFGSRGQAKAGQMEAGYRRAIPEEAGAAAVVLHL